MYSKDEVFAKAQAALAPIKAQKEELDRKFREIRAERNTTPKSHETLQVKLKSKLEDIHEAFAKVKSLENSTKRNAAREEFASGQIFYFYPETLHNIVAFWKSTISSAFLLALADKPIIDGQRRKGPRVHSNWISRGYDNFGFEPRSRD